LQLDLVRDFQRLDLLLAQLVLRQLPLPQEERHNADNDQDEQDRDNGQRNDQAERQLAAALSVARRVKARLAVLAARGVAHQTVRYPSALEANTIVGIVVRRARGAVIWIVNIAPLARPFIFW